LGGDSLALYPGGGVTGKLLETLLEEEGIQQQKLRIEEETRENVAVREEDTGRQLRLVMPGPDVEKSEWERCLGELESLCSKADYVVASGSLPPGVPEDFYAGVARIARDAKARLIVDTKGRALRLAARAGVYMLKPNMRELSHLVDQVLEDESTIEKAARRILSKCRCDILVLSLGRGGAMLFRDESLTHVPSPTVPIKSSVGAGDSMVAGMVLKLAQGEPLCSAVAFGVAAGAAAVMTPGSELCRRVDVERLFAQMERRKDD
jgi:6-phosphofructokinase 2